MLEWHTFADTEHDSVSHQVPLRQLEVHGRRYWILSEPHGSGWKSSVVELIDRDGEHTEPVGIDAVAETRGAADQAAERKLRRLLQAPPA